MSKKNKKKLFKSLPFGKMIPNIATLSALFVGMTQVKFALKSEWEFAVIAVMFAALLDATDGRLARFFNACSRFGAELDSLSDFAVFGLCPAISIYLYSLFNLNKLGWIVCVFFAVCMCLRLARFNTHDIENIKTPLSGKFFAGVPAPAGAILALFPIILFNAFEIEFFKNPYFVAANVIVAGCLCISKIPTLSIKKVHIKKEQYTMFLLCSVIAFGVIYAYTWKMFSLIVALYIVSIFFCIKKMKQILNSKADDKETSDNKL